MRKVLSFVLVLAMILGSVSMAFAANFSDTEGKTYATAAATLNELGVISGYADGTFGGDKNITRAEFATMIVNALGFTTTGAAATGFKDVPNDYWAAQAILTAKNLGITSGYSDGSFKPKANITCDEAIAMFVRALGYKAEYLMGTYPASYVNQAMTLGILDDVNTGSVAATRADVAQLIYNGLDCAMVSYQNTGVVVAGTDLISRLGYEKVSDKYIWDKLDANQGLFGTKYYNDKTEKAFFVPQSHFVTGNYTANSYITDADGVKTYAKTATTVTPAGFYNGEALTTGMVTGTNKVTYAISEKADAYGNYTVYSSVQWVGVDELAPETIQKDLESAAFVKLADGKTAKAGTYFLNGVAALADIKEDDVVTYYVSNAGIIRRVDVSTKTVTGKITKWDSNNAVYIDGVANTLASVVKTTDGVTVTPTTGNGLLGLTGTAYLNYAGKVAFVEAEEVAKNYAAVLGYTGETSTGVGTLNTANKGTVELLLADGTVVQKSYKGFDMSVFKYQVVEYGLTSDVVTTMAAVTTTTQVEKKVFSNSTIDGHYIASNCVTFVDSLDGSMVDAARKAATNAGWSVVDTASLLGNTYSKLGYVQATNDRIKLITISGTSTNTAQTYYVYTGSWVKTAATSTADAYYEFDVLTAGKQTTLTANETFGDTYLSAATGALELGAYGTITKTNNKVSAFATTTSAITGNYVKYKADSLSVQVGGTTWYSLDKDVVIYVVDYVNEEVVVGTTSDLAKAVSGNATGYKMYFYDHSTTPDGVYDVVVVAK